MSNKNLVISEDQNEVILNKFTAVFKASDRPTNCGGCCFNNLECGSIPCTANARRDKKTGIFIKKIGENKMKRTFMEAEQLRLIKRFHTLLSKLGMNGDDKADILYQYKVTSTKQLSCIQLIECCEYLQRLTSPQYNEMDKLRKRVIAAIDKWLRNNGKPSEIEYIKALACRAAGENAFNKISKTKLTAIYNTFCKYNRTQAATEDVIEEQTGKLTIADAIENAWLEAIKNNEIKLVGNI
ncbi:MAG: hypothetical protein LBR17_01270 [Bacteroidales bacterium]|jgi:hypothetical protein|nr:hypothetical protein [Bacteroidales bacterium]